MLGENLQDVGRAATAGARSALSAVNEWAAERERDMAAEGGSGSTVAAVRRAEGDRQHAAAKRADAGEQAERIVGQYEDGSPGYHAMGIARSAPMMAAALATRSPSLGALAIGGGTAAEQRSQALAEGATTGQATASGIAHGALEGSMDALTLGIARWGFGPVKELLTKRFGDTVATRMLHQASSTAPRRVALAAAQGAATEVPSTLGQMASDELILDRDYTAADYARGARDSAIQGGALSGGAYVATAPLRRAGARGADSGTPAPEPNASAMHTGMPGDDAIAAEHAAPSLPSSPEAQALREQAAQISTSGPLGNAAGTVLNARADALEQVQAESTRVLISASDGPWTRFAEHEGAGRTASEAATVIDEHIAALESAATDGHLDNAQLQVLTAERAQLDDTLRGHLRRREQGIAPADPAQARELQVALPALEARRGELDRQLERHRLAEGRATQLERLHERLSKIDRDADLIDLSERLVPLAGIQPHDRETSHDDFPSRRTGSNGPVIRHPVGNIGSTVASAAVSDGASSADRGQHGGAVGAGGAAQADAHSTAEFSRMTESPVRQALQDIANGASPGDALRDLGDADVHAVAKAMGRDFSPRAPAWKVAERLGDGERTQWISRASRAVAGTLRAAPAEQLSAHANEAATSPLNDRAEPTEAQKEAGNYKVGRVQINGHQISIENPAGSSRRPEWPPLKNHYGYIRGTIGKDKDHVDVFMTENAHDTARPVFVVDQVNKDGGFDEAKVIMGAATEAEARQTYLQNYSPGWTGLGAIREFTQDQFKAWVRDPKATKRPAASAGIQIEQAQRLTERFTKGWGPDAPRVVLVRSATELRQAAGLPDDASVSERAEGHWNGGPAVFLNVGGIDSPARMRQVLLHEALGHYGVDRVVSDWSAVTDAIGRHIQDGTGSSSVRSAIEQIRASQPQALNDPHTAAREVLAVMAEHGATSGLLDRVVAGVRRFLRERMPGLKLSSTELRDLVHRADGVLRRGAYANTAAPAATLFDPSTNPAGYFSRATDPNTVEPPDASRVASDFAHLDDRQRAALTKIDTHRAREGLAGKVKRYTDNWRLKAVQGVFDQFAPLKDLDETAYMQARLSKGTDGAVEAVFKYGTPKLSEGALDVRRDGKGFAGVLQDLAGEHDLFLAWVAGHRAEQLAAQGREHLFDGDEITALKRLSTGTMPDGRKRAQVYADAQRALNRYTGAVLDIAERAGLLNADSRNAWESEWYVPFYRAMEGERGVSPGQVDGLIRQQVIERLKGGAEPLGDLLHNTLSNWSHLLSASMKNLAATRALDAAVDLGAAAPAKAADNKGTVWAMKNGQQVHYTVSDPLVFDALTMLHHPGWNNPAMKSMQWFKRVLTTGVTSDPAFRIRNLMRDTVSVIAANPVGYNPLRNLVDGWKATEAGGDTYLKLLGGGGAIRFGSMLDGDQAANAKRLIRGGIARDGQVLDTPAKVKAVLSRSWEWWKEIGDRAETVNRAAIYQRAIADGKTHLEASYAARDALDFTMSGKWAAVRFLTQTVPFMNARLQGLHKLGRGAKADPRRFSAVTGAVAAASALLYLANRDDEEFRALPDWVRDTYWWVRLPGTDRAVFIPKPFEVGALGSVVERGTELMLAGDDYNARDFAGTMQSILSSQLSMNPVPQMVRPAMEAAFNWNSFQDRPIDGMGQERLPAEDRHTARTSAGAIAAGKMTGISPQRIEHMVRGYFGWLGVQALAVSDLLGRSALDMPSNPAHDLTRPENLAVIGAFVRSTSGAGSKYVNRYYRELDSVQQLYAAYTAARHAGEFERAHELRQDDRLKLRGLYAAADRQMKAINQRVRRVTADRTLSASAKAELLEGLHATRNRIAQRTTERARGRTEVLEDAQ